MRNIFIDCGYNVGDVTNSVHQEKGDQYEYFAFEANPYLFEAHKNRHPFCKLEQKAVWIEDCTLPFYVVKIDRYGKENPFTGASTLNKKKSQWNMNIHKEEEEVEAEAINFSNFILNNFKKEDNIVVKMDIEGAEYAILNKMLDDHSIDYINHLIVEFHDEKVQEDSKGIVKRIKEKNIMFTPWH